MAYFRGDPYIFDTGEHFHIWVRGRYTAHCDVLWDDERDSEGISGVQLPVEIVDRLVLMRLAELLVEKQAVTLLDAFLAEPSHDGRGSGLVPAARLSAPASSGIRHA